MASLLLGPMLRYVSETEATVWVETDEACEVQVLGHRSRTFHVDGKHYGLVAIRGLEPGSSTEYELALDGVTTWPPPVSPFPAPRIQTLPTAGEVAIAWGSCRVTAPNDLPYTLSADEDERGSGVDALSALAVRLCDQDPARWPRMLLLIGDQVYADDVSPQTRAFIEARRDTSRPPGLEVHDVDEYAMLYREAWSPAAIRWLMSTVPSAMIFDDHDVHDDWNTSEAWIEDMRRTDWWHDRIVSGLWTYWIYQHLGNLSPDELHDNGLYQGVLAADDGAPLLRAFAQNAERQGGGSLWSFSRRIAGTRLVVIDAREGRVLSDGRRDMLDEQEWEWLEQQLTGDYDHVIIASTLPVLLAPTLHYLEAWNEAVCQGAWGRRAARWSEKLRRALDLEHWAAFQTSFHRLIELIQQVGSGRRGAPPASIVMLGGDVHQAYLETVEFRWGHGVQSNVYQAVCSPFRNQLGKRDRRMLRIVRRSRLIGRLARRLAHLAGVSEPAVRWQVLQQPTWRNQLGWLHLDGRALRLTIETTRQGHAPELEISLEHQLA
ncbi:MAG: alkaline phosphatase family protein [Actinomycetota bacterium]|nr:alkaline phosphatase family protein [Actinomycetota bacterium]